MDSASLVGAADACGSCVVDKLPASAIVRRPPYSQGIIQILVFLPSKSTQMQIRIMLNNNKTLSVTVSPNDDIQKVKKTIQEQEAIPMDQQRFIFEGKPVPDNASLSKIGEGSLLHLEREVQAETPAEASGIAAEGTNTLPNSSIQQAPATQYSHNFNYNTATDDVDAQYGNEYARGAQHTGSGHTYNENKASGKAKVRYGNTYQ
jgi:hypothetical protein